jgi:predicted dehydrogenase
VRPLRLAVIGAGHLGRIHARLARSLEGAELVAVADTSKRAREEVAAEMGVRVVEDFHHLIGGIDAAIVATPTSTHGEVGCRLLDAGIPLFVEKPLAGSITVADELVRRAQSRGLVLQVGHVERFNPAFTAASPLLCDVRYISAERLSGYPARSTDVGVVLDLMIHDLDIAQSVAAAPVRGIDAYGAVVIGPHEDVATARLEFENGCIASLTASRVSYVSRRLMHLFTPAGYIAVDFASRESTAITLVGANGSTSEAASVAGSGKGEAAGGAASAGYLRRQDFHVAACNPIADEQAEFVASVSGTARPRVPGTAGRDAVALAERVLESMARQKWDGHELARIQPPSFPADSALLPVGWHVCQSEPPRRAAG